MSETSDPAAERRSVMQRNHDNRAPDARPPFRFMAAVMCVVMLAGAMLAARRALDGEHLWAVVTLLGITYGLGLGQLALTGRWLLGRNYRL